MRPLVLGLLAGTALFAQGTLHLTLREAERLAVQNNPRVSAARYDAEASREIPKELRANYQPTVFGNITGAGASEGSRIAAGALNNPVIYNRFASGVGVSQLLTDFGRTGNLVASAESRAQAQLETSNAARARVLLTVDAAYFGLLRAQVVLEVARQTVSARQLVADQITALARNSLKSSLDVSFANVNLAEAKLLLASAENGIKASAATLANAIGYPSQQHFTLSDETLPGAPPGDVKELIAEALHDRPEVAALRYELEGANRFARAEHDLKMPAISMVATVGLVPAGVAQLQDRYGAAGVNLNIPILNGGLFKARQTEAEMRARGAGDNVKDMENRVVRDVQIAYLNAQTGYEKLSLTQKLLEQAQLSLELAQRRYDLGLSAIVELSQAQLNLTSAQIANANAKYDYQAQWSALQYEIGALK